jgi:hypothetical protein
MKHKKKSLKRELTRKRKAGNIPVNNPGNRTKIVVITVIALLVVGALLFFGLGGVGQAIFFEAPAQFTTAGAEAPIDLPKKAGDIVTLRIGATIDQGKESVAYEFEVDYPSEKLQLIDVDSKLIDDWGSDFLRTTPTQDHIKFEHGTINPFKAIKGPNNVRLAEVNFRALTDINTADDLADLQITDVTVLDLASDEDFFPEATAFFQPSGEVICAQQDQITQEACLEEFETLMLTADCTAGDSCEANQVAVYCATNPEECDSYTSDINNDGEINGQDAFIIFKINEANVNSCGDDGQAPCKFGDNYVCDGSTFRVNGYKNFVASGTYVCPFPDMEKYLNGKLGLGAGQ